MNKYESRTEEILTKKKKIKDQAAHFAVVPNSCLAGSRGARGAVLAPEHPEGLECCQCPGVLPTSPRPALGAALCLSLLH